LSRCQEPHNTEAIEAFLRDRVKRLVAKCKRDSRDNPVARDKLPLIRIRVDYSGGFSNFNAQRFGQQFVTVVANPRDILHFFRKRATTTAAGKGAAGGGARHIFHTSDVPVSPITPSLLLLSLAPRHSVATAIHLLVRA